MCKYMTSTCDDHHRIVEYHTTYLQAHAHPCPHVHALFSRSLHCVHTRTRKPAARSWNQQRVVGQEAGEQTSVDA